MFSKEGVTGIGINGGRCKMKEEFEEKFKVYFETEEETYEFVSVELEDILVIGYRMET